MKYDTKYCYIENNGKNYQLILTKQYPEVHFALEYILAHTRFLMPIGALISAIFVGVSLASGLINSIALQLCICFLTTTGICYLPKVSFPTGLTVLLRNEKITKTLNKFYKEMRTLEFNKLSGRMNEIECLTKQQKIASEMLKMFKNFEVKSLKQAVKYEKKLAKGKDFPPSQTFAYAQIESSILTIDKFIFHNFMLLKQLCPEHEEYINNRVNYYNRTIIQQRRHISDEVFRVGLKRGKDKILNDDIFKRESTYPVDLCKKTGFLKTPKHPEQTISETEPLKDENHKIKQQNFAVNLIDSNNLNEFSEV